MRLLLTLGFVALATACNRPQGNDIRSEREAARSNDVAPHPASSSEAIQIAEAFIVANGYTDAPPDRSKLASESIEFARSEDELLDLRRNTLLPRALCALGNGGAREAAEARAGERNWLVVFRPASSLGQDTGRGVRIKDGRAVRVEHQGLLLSACDATP